MNELSKKFQVMKKKFKKEMIKEGILSIGLGVIALGTGIDSLLMLDAGNYSDEVESIRELISPITFVLSSSYAIVSYGIFKIMKNQYEKVKKGEFPINYTYFN